MSEYHKIQTVYLRDPATKHRTLLEGQWALPVFDYLQNNPWTFTEKVDGTNIRVMLDRMTVGFAGRTNEAQMPPNLAKALVALFNDDNMNAAFPDSGATEESMVVLYGEGYGATIQKGGGNYLPTPSFCLFDVTVGGIFLERHNVEDVAAKLNLSVAPVIGEGTLHEMIEMARAGIMSHWGPFNAEGIVARPKCEMQTRMGQRVITKIKCRDFASK